MNARTDISLLFVACFALAVCGCGSESEGDVPSTPGAKRLLSNEVAMLTQSVQDAGGRTLLKPESNTVLVRFNDSSFGDAELAGLKQLEAATGFNARGGQITDEGLAQLASAGQQITTLELTGNPITDAGLVHLQQMSNLTFVSLDDTQVTQNGVDELQRAMPHLNVGFFQ